MDEGDICVVCKKDIPSRKRYKTAECDAWGCARRSCCYGSALDDMYVASTRDLYNRGRALAHQCHGCLRSWCESHHEEDAVWRTCEACDLVRCDMCAYKHFSTCPGCDKTVCTGTDAQCWNTEEGYEMCQKCLRSPVTKGTKRKGLPEKKKKKTKKTKKKKRSKKRKKKN